jgi:hypothetical protein
METIKGTEGEGLALSLPGEVWAEVAGFLSTRDLLRLASANSRLRYNTTLRTIIFRSMDGRERLEPGPITIQHSSNYKGSSFSSRSNDLNKATDGREAISPT